MPDDMGVERAGAPEDVIEPRGTVDAEPRFLPHGACCEADDGRGSEFGRCNDPAYGYAVDGTRERFVCFFHWHRWPGRLIRGTRFFTP